MKKIFGVIMIVLMAGRLMSFGNSKTPTSQLRESEAINVEEIADISNINITTVARCGCDSEGFGRCLERGCYCKEFKGRGQTCGNCGHAYKRHY